MSVRQVLVVINVVALAALGAFAYISVQRNRERPTPQNLAVFHDDETLEGVHLERVLGWALFFAAIIAVALPIYWLREPNRQHESVHYFDEGAVNRGATLFSNNQMPAYDQAKSLQCANCHGTDLGGGGTSVAHIYKDKSGAFVTWRAPALNTVLQRFSPQEVNDIITYGRPGTPMQPWGVLGGGPKNEQSINDIVAFITSKQLTSAQAKQQSDKNLAAWAGEPAQQLSAAQTALTTAQKALVAAKANAKSTPADIAVAQKAVDDADTALKWAQDWAKRREHVSQGQLLFEVNCARCHTLGWSVFDPTLQKPENVISQPGGGAFGPDLSQEKARFTDDKVNGTGAAQQIAFISLGSDFNKPYGNNGVGNGKMPGFGGMLTQEQIAEIVQYEREGLDQTTDQLVGVDYPGARY
ncbi:MAG TPA: c-type cytochrome [Acidimicrobiia bacterium]